MCKPAVASMLYTKAEDERNGATGPFRCEHMKQREARIHALAQRLWQKAGKPPVGEQAYMGKATEVVEAKNRERAERRREVAVRAASKPRH